MKVVFFGTPTFAVSGLKGLVDMPGVDVTAVVTQPDRPAGRGGEVRPSPVKEAALAKGIDVFQPKSVRKEFDELAGGLSAHGPFDIGIVIAFGQILPRAMLDLPRMGCVNVHASLLPRWRGAAPIQRAILAGDRETGVCLMKMDEGLDTGGVFSRSVTSIERSDTLGSLHDRLATMGAQLLARDLEAIVGGRLVAEDQPSDGVTYAAKITSADCRINWGSDANEIDCLVRGMNPVPGAFTMLGGKRLKIFGGRPTRNEHGRAPGEALSVRCERFEIACGRGTFVVTDLQPEGKRRMPSADFVRGLQLGTPVNFS
jgi:methionyl-tRNA formyltransferase